MTGLQPLRVKQQIWRLRVIYVYVISLCLSQILYTGIVIYAPALALNQGRFQYTAVWFMKHSWMRALEAVWFCSVECAWNPPSLCSNWYGSVGCSYFHGRGLHLLLHDGTLQLSAQLSSADHKIKTIDIILWFLDLNVECTQHLFVVYIVTGWSEGGGVDRCVSGRLRHGKNNNNNKWLVWYYW